MVMNDWTLSLLTDKWNSFRTDPDSGKTLLTGEGLFNFVAYITICENSSCSEAQEVTVVAFKETLSNILTEENIGRLQKMHDEEGDPLSALRNELSLFLSEKRAKFVISVKPGKRTEGWEAFCINISATNNWFNTIFICLSKWAAYVRNSQLMGKRKLSLKTNSHHFIDLELHVQHV